MDIRDACHLPFRALRGRCAWRRRRCDRFQHATGDGRVREVPMATIEIHGPEVRHLKLADRSGTAVPPRADLVVGKSIASRAMFSDSLLEFRQQRRRRALATTTSFIFNCLAVGVMLIMPLLFTDDLPKAQLLTFLVAPPPPPPPPPPAAEQVQRVVRQVQTDLLNSGQLRTPSKIPQKVQMIHEEEAPPPMPVTGAGVIGGF